jgi:hypothetical protein
VAAAAHRDALREVLDAMPEEIARQRAQAAQQSMRAQHEAAKRHLEQRALADIGSITL